MILTHLYALLTLLPNFSGIVEDLIAAGIDVDSIDLNGKPAICYMDEDVEESKESSPSSLIIFKLLVDNSSTYSKSICS